MQDNEYWKLFEISHMNINDASKIIYDQEYSAYLTPAQVTYWSKSKLSQKVSSNMLDIMLLFLLPYIEKHQTVDASLQSQLINILITYWITTIKAGCLLL